MSARDYGQMSMRELFGLEAESQAEVLTAGLLDLERAPGSAAALERCMRAAHSLKGAARIVDLRGAVTVAHEMEDAFVAAQHGRLTLDAAIIDAMLRGVDLLLTMARAGEGAAANADTDAPAQAFVQLLQAAVQRGTAPVVMDAAPAPTPAPSDATAEGERILRVTAHNLDRLLALAGESRVESRWIKPFADALLRSKRLHQEIGRDLDALREALPRLADEEGPGHVAYASLRNRLQQAQHELVQRLAELETHDRRAESLSSRLYDEALACRMRPFRDGTAGFPRMVRDLGKSLGKSVRLELAGDATPVDRDILERLEAPLTHLLRNAVDHGIELPDDRRAAGKPVEGVVVLHAAHSGGMLQVTVADDGHGVDCERLRAAVVSRGLAVADMAAQFSEAELLEFLFLPGFTMKPTVSEISGRGVGLDVVQDTLRQVRGSVRIASEPGRGTRFVLKLPLTLSVVRALIVQVGGEPYGLPLAYVDRVMRVGADSLRLLEGRQHVDLDGAPLGLVPAHQVLGLSAGASDPDSTPVIVVGDAHGRYGLVVERLLGEHELVVQALDPRLGKIKDISAGALMTDGTPLLIVDVEDLIHSVRKLVSAGQLQRLGTVAAPAARRKRVLVVDDSLTVRELERKLLDGHGYEVEVAVDGIDGWNAMRTQPFDLVVTDVDMPRLDGIELVRRLKADPALRALPVMIVSYKDREEDRRRGLDAGADYYLAKGSFQDRALLDAVVDLIGEA
ncbi:MAG: cheA [Panacagrimonas sp.]|nr:hybrid sensor histidine kinase/response regulator [Panacagrimonas sp.]MCC2656917.1 cheA [Panacagrimonas sp.]